MNEATVSAARPPTPPHHPTYNIRLSAEKISQIITHLFPDRTLDHCQQLPSGQSFNNRIYFVKLATNTAVSSKNDISHDLVLKVSGQFFGPDKVQNEVSCLLLLEKHCPEVPAPRLVAWSEDGVVTRKVFRFSPYPNNDVQIHTTAISGFVNESVKVNHRKGRGWILMSRVPGQALQASQAKVHGKDLLKQLAQIVALWRKNLPAPSPGIGNLLISTTDSDMMNPDQTFRRREDSLSFKVQGLLIAGKSPTHLLLTSQAYYKYKLYDQLHILETEDVFAPNRELVSSAIRSLTSDVLPRISLFRHGVPNGKEAESETPRLPVFTQYDLSPRNILVSTTTENDSSPPTITGILDFEFAGFFPPEEEFTNCRINNPDDWTEDAWNDGFIAELEKLGVEMLASREWHQACSLIRIIESIAPWYLREGGVQGEDLRAELEKASNVIQKEIKDLEMSLEV